MRKIVFFLFFFFITSSAFSNINIAYLDVQFIIDNSNLGKLYKSEIIENQNKNKIEIKNKEKIIKNKENEFNNQKNILNENEIKKKLNEINNLINDYKVLRNNLNKKILDRKKNYSAKILKILNPLITKYVEKNKIDLVLEKKNVLVGIKTLDITNDILNIFNKETENIKITDVN